MTCLVLSCIQHSGVFTTGVVYFSRSPDTANANQTRAQSIINTLSEDPGQNPPIQPENPPESTDHRLSTNIDSEPVTYRPTIRPSDAVTEYSLHVPVRAAVSQPAPFTLPKHLTTENPIYFHYITKSPASNTTQLNGEDSLNVDNRSTILPTTYAPPKYFLKSLLPRPITASTISDSPIFSSNTFNITDNGVVVLSKPKHAVHKPHKTIKTIRKLNNTANTIEEPPTDNDTNKQVVSSIHFGTGSRQHKPISYRHSTLVKTKLTNKESLSTSTVKSSTTSATTATTTTTTTVATTIPTESTTKLTEKLATVTTPRPIDEEYINDRIISQYNTEKYRNYIAPKDEKRFRNTVEIPPAHELIYEQEDLPKPEQDQPPAYKPKPILLDVTKTVADAPRTTATPARTSRVNTAIKSLIAFGGTRRPDTKCYDTPNVKCNDLKQRYLFLQLKK